MSATVVRRYKPKPATKLVTTTEDEDCGTVSVSASIIVPKSLKESKSKIKKEKASDKDKDKENNNHNTAEESSSKESSASNNRLLSLSPSASSTAINEEGLEDLRTAFRLLDKNSDGRVTTPEMQSMLKAFGIEIPYKHVRRVVDNASSAGALKGLSESDFINWIKPLLLETDLVQPDERPIERTEIEKDLLAAFQLFDKDGNGYITKDELKRAMELIGEDVSDEELDEMLNLGDIDKDGQIDYGEFAKILA